MASIVPTKQGRYRAFINKADFKGSKTFDRKAEAQAWASRIETEIDDREHGRIPDKTFGDLLVRYRDQVSPTKRGAKYEILRINKFLGNDDPQRGPLRDPDPITKVSLRRLDGTDVAAWRDGRKAAGLQRGSIQREWNLLAAACAVAVTEWKWLKASPFSRSFGVKRPGDGPKRDEVFLDADMEALQQTADSHLQSDVFVRVMRCVRFCNETAMRAGEMLYCGDHPHLIDVARRVAKLPKGSTKNGLGREVALSEEAIRLWQEARAHSKGGNVWGFNSGLLDAQWRNLRDQAAKTRPEVKRLHFHDTRHTATTRLAKKIQVLDLARMTGHTDLKQLLTYYNESMESIAAKL